MGDVWVKGSKVYCEHCRIHVHSNAVSRRNHETSTKHVNAVQNQLRNVLKKQEGAKRVQANLTHILARIDKAATDSHTSQDAGAVPANLSSMPSSGARKIPTKPNISLYGYGQGYQEKDARNYHPTAPIWSPPINFSQEAPNAVSDFGPWVAVEQPAPVEEETEQKHITVIDDTYEDEDTGGDKTKDFKLIEKILKLTDDDTKDTNTEETLVFKKRKFSAQNNMRKSRKKE